MKLRWSAALGRQSSLDYELFADCDESIFFVDFVSIYLFIFLRREFKI